MKLTIELVPSTSWYSNVRSMIPRKEWAEISKYYNERAGGKCEVCGEKSKNRNLDCHEIWEYTEGTPNIQRLKGFVSLCERCHEVKHIGLASVKGRIEEATSHFMKVNKINISEAHELISAAFSMWKKRSELQWEIDISYLDTFKKSKEW